MSSELMIVHASANNDNDPLAKLMAEAIKDCHVKPGALPITLTLKINQQRRSQC